MWGSEDRAGQLGVCELLRWGKAEGWRLERGRNLKTKPPPPPEIAPRLHRKGLPNVVIHVVRGAGT